MAVIEAIPGVAITVQVAGRPLKEWPDDNEDPRHHAVVRYVEAVSGQEFDIKVQVQDEAVFQENSLTFHVHIDGQRTQSFTSWPGGRKVTIFRGIRDATSMRRYRFSNLQISESVGMVEMSFRLQPAASDDHHLDDEPEQLDGLGEIQVLMYHTRKIDEPRKRQPLPRNYREQSIVSEKMLKGQSVSHCVAYVSIYISNPTRTNQIPDLAQQCRSEHCGWRLMVRKHCFRGAWHILLGKPRLPIFSFAIVHLVRLAHRIHYNILICCQSRSRS